MAIALVTGGRQELILGYLKTLTSFLHTHRRLICQTNSVTEKSLPQLCIRGCFYDAFAAGANCGNLKVADNPDVQRQWAGDRICNLTVGSNQLIKDSLLKFQLFRHRI